MDPIADMLSRIRNAISASKNEVVMPHSKMKETIWPSYKKIDISNLTKQLPVKMDSNQYVLLFILTVQMPKFHISACFNSWATCLCKC
jgi:ribosomal protein S8